MSSALEIRTTAPFGRLPQLDGGDQGLEIIEHQLNQAGHRDYISTIGVTS